VRFIAVGDVPAVPLATAGEPGLDIVFQPPDALRPLAEPLHVLDGHTQFVQALAFSPDGAWLATGSEDGTLRIWDVRGDFACTHVASDHDSAINCVAFTADGKQLLTASDDHTVKLWSVPAFEFVATLHGHSDFVSKVCPAGPGRAVSSGRDGTLRVWDLETAEQLAVMEHGNWVTALAASRDGRFAIASSDRNVMRIWDLANARVERVLLDASANYIGEVMGMQVAADNTSGLGHRHAPKQILYGPGDATFLSCEDDLVEWDAATAAELGRSEADGWTLAGVAYIPDRASLLRAHAEPVERAFVEQLERGGGGDVRAVYGDWLEERGRLAEANSVRRHGAFRYVFAGTNDAVHVIDLGLRAIVAQAAWPHGDVHNVAVSPDGRLAASGSHEGVVGIWDIDALLHAGLPDRHLATPVELAVSQDGIALSGTSDRTVRLWNRDGANRRLPPTDGQFATLAFTPDGQIALVMNDTGVLQTYDARTGAARGTARRSEGRYGPFSRRAFLRDGRMLVGSTSGPLALWTIDPPAAPELFEGDAGQVTALAVDEDRDLVATAQHASRNDPLRIALWSLARRAPIHELVFQPPGSHYGCSIAIVEVAGDVRIVVGTSEGGLVVLDRAGAVVHALQLAGYLFKMLPLRDGVVAVGADQPWLVDVAAGRALAQVRAAGMQWHPIAGTSRAVVGTPDGAALFDFATLRGSAPIPGVSPVETSPDGAFVVARRDDDIGMPTLLRARWSP